MSLKKNVIANYLGQGWTALMGIAFVPLYISYLGMEAYGLIGVFAILQAWLTLLDMGMTPTLNREMARFAVGAHTTQSIRDLLRSLEVICYAVALLVSIAIWLFASWLSTHWLNAEKLPVEEVTQAITIMGFVMALRFVESLYRGAIQGLQKQVWLSFVGSGIATLRGVGAVCVLAWVSPSMDAFFIWHGALSVLTILIFIFGTYAHLPTQVRSARFSLFQLKEVKRFAGGVMVTTLLSLLLMQVDKIILSRILSLEMFGYYTLAGSVAATLYQLISPITQVYYPRFTELVTKGDTAQLVTAFHQATQLISILIIPAALMLIFFGENMLTLWMGNARLAHDIEPILVVLTLGTMLHGLMHAPYILTLAYDWSGFGVRQNIIAVVVLLPAILWASSRYGVMGAAWTWVILNMGYFIISAQYIFRRLLPKEKRRWYLMDIASPFMAALTTVGMLWFMRPTFSMRFAEFAWLVVTGFFVVVAAALGAPDARKILVDFARRFAVRIPDKLN